MPYSPLIYRLAYQPIIHIEENMINQLILLFFKKNTWPSKIAHGHAPKLKN